MNTEFLDKFEVKPPAHRFSAMLRIADQSKIRTLPANLDPERVFTFEAQISNQKLDSHRTRMSDSSLRNYAEDAVTGVAFLDSHDRKNRVGYSFDSRYVDGENPQVFASFYTVRGLQLGSVSTDSFIQGVEYDLIRDVSIGFKEGENYREICSICAEDIWGWDCMHIPGVRYSVVTNPDAEPSQQIEEERMCFVWIEDARLSEVSAVYDGSTPDAMIAKATRELRAERLSSDTLAYLENKYRINLPKPTQVRGANLNKESNMAEEKNNPSGAPDKMLAREIALEARSVGIELDTDKDVVEMVRTIVAEVQRLQPLAALADEGKVLRQALVEDTLKEGVRAFGNDFNREEKEAMLGKVDVETVRALQQSWKALADSQLPKGRTSADDPEGDGGGDGDGDDEPVSTAGDEAPPEAFGNA